MDLDFYNPITNPGVLAKIRTDGDGISNSFGALSFHTTRTPNSLVERIRITSEGNVGIGTTSPAVALDVVGAINSTTDATLSGVRVGKGAGAIASNTAVGSGA